MRSFLTFLAVVPAIIAAPLKVRQDDNADKIAGQWIVQLNQDSVLSEAVGQVTQALGAEPKFTYEIGSFKGLAVSAPDNLLDAVSSLASVASIEADSRVTTNALVTQQGAPYGLARISHSSEDYPTDEYVYDDTAGAGTFSYIIDTGIYVENNDFDGRATFGANFADDGLDTDGNGHGTHVAGTTGSTTYGVAKKTNLIAVKVLDADGAGAISQVLAGVDWAVNDMKSKGRTGKSVANLSLGGIFSPSTNAAITAANEEGLFTAIAAGNSGLPTITSSPASAMSACTVGAIGEDSKRASFSNFGLLVDVFAPGVDVLSTWIDGPDDTNIISGTSMASPHVAGLGAYLLGLEGDMGPAELCQRVKDLSTKGQIGFVSALLSGDRIAYNGNEN